MIRSIDAESSTDRGVFAVSVVILACLTVAEIVRQGAFYRTDALVVLVVSLGLISMCVRGTDSRSRLMIVAFVALGAWWYLTAVIHGRAASFFPLGASVVGFLAAFLVVRRIGVAHRQVAGELMATIGAGAAAVGLAASAMRWYPLAMPSQNLWRLATTLTYSDAAGLLLGVSLLVAVGLNLRKPLVRLDVSLCAAGVIATQSRGAVLALLVGGLLVPFGTLRKAPWPLLAGLAAGLTLVGTSSGLSRQPIAGVAVAALVVVGAVVRPSARLHLRTPPRALALAGAVIAVGAVVAVALHTPVQRRVGLASTSDRVSEWHAAFDQWRSSFWVGVGPDKVLHLKSPPGSYAYFAHDEFLQIAAGAGIVGVLLLLLALGAIAMTVRRTDTLSSCAAGAVVAFAAAALLDFDWHLAALGLVGGWATALACPPEGSRVPTSRGAPARVRRFLTRAPQG